MIKLYLLRFSHFTV